MRYSVCVIDNDIPAAGAEAQAHGIVDSELLNASNLQLLLQKEEWGDDVLKKLIEKLLGQKDADGISPKWEVYGFTNPSFYINAINDGFFRSDLLVFDWEYPGAQNVGINSENILKEILDRTFCLVFIFSKADKKAEIEAILAKSEFQPYKERLTYLDKSTPEGDQTDALLLNAEGMYADNFSFRFANLLRKKSVQCADQILSDMGRASLNDVRNLLVVGEGGKKDFIDFLAERFRTSIAGRTVYDLVDSIPAAPNGGAPDESLAAKVWSYRLYFQQETGDELVRRGDIVSVNGIFSLILSADCDLGYFWKKNLGIINAVALHELNQSNATLKAWLTLCVKADKLSHRPINSLLGQVGELSEGPFVLPFVPATEGLKNFIAIPKDLCSTKINTPDQWNTFTERQKKEHPMRYSYWTGAKRICTVSEPFLTPVIQHVLNTLGGIGVPDYPDQMIAILKNILADFSSQAAIAAAPAAVPPPVQPAARTATAGPAASMPATAETVSQPAVASPAEIPAQAAPAGAEIPADQDKADPVGPSVPEPTGEAQ